jgi:hypothetical protein
MDKKRAVLKGCFLSSVIYCLLCFSACQTQTDKTPVLGDLDSAAIAIDTNMQKGFESSYEFHKTLVVNPTLVYDVIAFGGPASLGEFAILRRGADNKSDTVMKGIREGIIAETFLADSNNNKREEVYVVIQNPKAEAEKKVFRFEKQ